MELQLFLQEFDDASKQHDHFKMLSAMQKFYSAIHNADEKNGTLLGLYSMAQQLEKMGMNGDIIKEAVISRITSQHQKYSALWKDAATGLNSLLEGDRKHNRLIVIT